MGEQKKQEHQKDWTAEQYHYIQWLSVPKKEKTESETIPGTQMELAETLGVSRRTLQRWKKLPGFQDAVYGEVRRHLDWRLPEILEALATKAETGDVPAIALSLKVAGRYQERQDIHLFEREYGADEFKKGSEFCKQYEEDHFGEGAGAHSDEKTEGAGED